MKLGVSSYTFTWAIGVSGHFPEKRMNEIDLINLVKDLGIGLLQIADNMPLHDMSESRVNDFLKIAKDSDIDIEVGANIMTADRLEKYISLAEKANSRLLRFAIDGKDYHPGLDEIIPIIKNAEPELKKRNIILALENHDRLFSSDFKKIIEKVNSPFVGICLDCANSLGIGEGLREVVKELAPYTVNFHLKEVLIKRKYHMMGFDIEGRPFGEGFLPLEWMLTQLTSKCKTAILEQWTPPEESVEKSIVKEREWAKKSIKYLRPFF